MPLGVLSEEQFEVEFKNIVRGRGNVLEMPMSVRKYAAAEVISGTPAKQVAEQLGISPASIAAYKNSATSTATYDKPDAELAESNQNVRASIIGPAQSKLIAAIEAITPAKLGEAKVRDAASIAAAMSTVIKNITPESKSDNSVKIAIYAPRKNEEEDFEVIQVER